MDVWPIKPPAQLDDNVYIPSSFEVDDSETLHEFIERYSFATLITTVDSVPFATHLPLLLDRTAGPFGTLHGHFAKANPHWRSLEQSGESLAIFHGPHTYVSPRWYSGAKPAVPTWNYAVVHAYGTVTLQTEPAWLDDFLRRMAIKYEADADQPWQNDLPPDLDDQLKQAIVGFEMTVTRLEGKFKLGQNRSDEDQLGVIAGLDQAGLTEMATFAREHLDANPDD
ncbi:FMN-binding negative transcriptional regulator [Rubinisphaera margarita]|uniref:FMN-binding negative transcriptional regulator n=1 Tax=Rubinisphaera margarita TaxID=2909586 RepID=UPI001EE83559|nr:FMN-binding negative transcriptional regulator [Rubinisphaera margarita]MCG6156511.1 FMN-binding negative transcriptional regulator [Rubinisphaera margarita]